MTRDLQPLATPGHHEIRPRYRPDIDGLRAVAIISVVLYHVDQRLLPGGFIGVDIFFVISGFLISSLIFKELDRGAFGFADFYVRRVRRIFPALILMICAVWIVAGLLFTHSEFVQLGQFIVGSAAFVSNLLQWRISGYFDTEAALKPLQHLWSLGIEEQFYIVWPVTVVVLWRWKKAFPVLLLSAMALSFAFNIWRTPHHATGAFYLPFGRAWELLLGAMLAWHDRQGGLSAAREARLGGVALKHIAAGLAVAMLAAGFIAIGPDSEFPGWWALLPGFGGALAIWAGEDAWLNAGLLARPWMVFVGLISYPLYIWHWPALSILRILSIDEPSLTRKFAAVAVAVLLAVATYLLVERPLRRARWSHRAITGVLAGAMLAICLIGGLSALGKIRTPRMAWDAAQEAAAMHAWDRDSDCSSFIPKGALTAGYCHILGDPTLKKTYVIWGDSHAHALVWMAARFAQERGARLVEFAVIACPPVAGVRRAAPHNHLGEACNSLGLAEEFVSRMQALKPQAIIVAARWTLYFRGFRNGGMNDQGPVAENTFVTTDAQGEATAETSKSALEQKIPETLRRLAKIAPVVVIKTVPTLRSTIEIGLARNPNGYEPTLAEYRAYEAQPNAIVDAAAREIPRVTLLDPAQVLCDARKCHAIIAGVRMYGDDNTHVSDAGAMKLEPLLRRLVK